MDDGMISAVRALAKFATERGAGGTANIYPEIFADLGRMSDRDWMDVFEFFGNESERFHWEAAQRSAAERAATTPTQGPATAAVRRSPNGKPGQPSAKSGLNL